MSSSAKYRPFLGSFRHIPPQEHFVKLGNFNFRQDMAVCEKCYLVKIGPKSLGDARQTIKLKLSRDKLYFPFLAYSLSKGICNALKKVLRLG